jgi:hypothetical protein
MAEEQDDPNELTWPEIDAIMGAARDREAIRRSRGAWHTQEQYGRTDLLESAIRKLKNRYHLLHPSALIVEPNDG